jgi:hypothetical protein
MIFYLELSLKPIQILKFKTLSWFLVSVNCNTKFMICVWRFSLSWHDCNNKWIFHWDCRFLSIALILYKHRIFCGKKKKSYPRKDLQLQKVTIWSLTTSFKYLYDKFGYKLHIMWFDVAIVNAMCWDLCLISPWYVWKRKEIKIMVI